MHHIYYEAIIIHISLSLPFIHRALLSIHLLFTVIASLHSTGYSETYWQLLLIQLLHALLVLLPCFHIQGSAYTTALDPLHSSYLVACLPLPGTHSLSLDTPDNNTRISDPVPLLNMIGALLLVSSIAYSVHCNILLLRNKACAFMLPLRFDDVTPRNSILLDSASQHAVLSHLVPSRSCLVLPHLLSDTNLLSSVSPPSISRLYIPFLPRCSSLRTCTRSLSVHNLVSTPCMSHLHIQMSAVSCSHRPSIVYAA